MIRGRGHGVVATGGGDESDDETDGSSSRRPCDDDNSAESAGDEPSSANFDEGASQVDEVMEACSVTETEVAGTTLPPRVLLRNEVWQQATRTARVVKI